jgi:hypothetical protein
MIDEFGKSIFFYYLLKSQNTFEKSKVAMIYDVVHLL